MKNAYALLIAGDEERFAADINGIKEFLVDEALFDQTRINLFYGSHHNIKTEIESFFNKIKGQKVVIVYSGHGNKGKIYPTKIPLQYEELGKLISSVGQFIFINDTCYSGSCIPIFTPSLLPEKGLVITSCQEDEKTNLPESMNSLFLENIISSYRKKQPFKPILQPKWPVHVLDFSTSTSYEMVETPIEKLQHPQRCGLSLDHLLFPQ